MFSDATLRSLDDADPVLRRALQEHGTHWDRIDVLSSGRRHSFSGNGMAAVHRRALLELLQQQAEQAGVEMLFGVTAPPLAQLRAGYDLVIGADGTNSATRASMEAEGTLGHTVETAAAKFIWFGTPHRFEGLTFLHRVSPHGNFAVHAYPISDELSTFIAETDADAWRAAGLDAFDVSQPSGPSDLVSQAYLETLFADDLVGRPLVANNSRWGNFRTRRTEQWWRDNVVLLGDAVHTAHFSVGSGTKMAMEDAVELARRITALAHGEGDLATALDGYQRQRQAGVARIQTAARPSLSWWENFGLYQQTLDPLTFAFHFFSRSIGIERIARRDPAFVSQVRGRWQDAHGARATRAVLPGLGPSPLERTVTLESVGEFTATLRDSRGERADVPVLNSPGEEKDLSSAKARLPRCGAVVIVGEPTLARTLLAEEARLRRGLITVVAGPDVNEEEVAETMILSGRADAVATGTTRIGAR
ncbi:hypothetical protein Kisp02_30880 [Kineosporia sp. NBRC 101731]|nr:hypothetical protein Kisp02_30880 [Kineosporia sp. NBRC 101731]